MATKGKTFILALICALVFAACDNDDDNTVSGPTYGNNDDNDTIVGPTYDHDTTAVDAYTLFYGNVAKGNGLYTVMLSSKMPDEFNYTVPNSINYVVSFVTEPVGDDEAPVLPEGTYTYTNDSTVSSIIDYELYCWDTQADGFDSTYYFVDATLTIAQTGDGNYKIEFSGTDTNGETHHMVFNGEPRILDEHGYTNEPTTTMKGDTILDLSRAIVNGYYSKGTAVNDNSQWQLVWEWPDLRYDGTHYLQITVITDAAGFTADGFCGSYTADSDRYPNHTGTAGTFALGCIYGGIVIGSYYHYWGETPVAHPRACFLGGTVDITPTDGEENTYNLKFDFFDENGNHITGEWTGPILAIDESGV